MDTHKCKVQVRNNYFWVEERSVNDREIEYICTRAVSLDNMNDEFHVKLRPSDISIFTRKFRSLIVSERSFPDDSEVTESVLNYALNGVISYEIEYSQCGRTLTYHSMEIEVDNGNFKNLSKIIPKKDKQS